jgi:ABC-type antimicrobial peptide transport system permease subunit
MFSYWPQRTNKFMVKIKAGKEKETIDKIGKFVQAYNPGFSFDYKFLDDDYQAQYEGEKRVSSLSQYFAGLTILISCLGLFGLATFTAERKVKEISIRKVLGASVLRIFYLLTSDFIKIVFVAIVIALPLSYFAAAHWLDSFAYRIELKWWYFLSAGTIGLLIAWVTVGMQAIRAAKVNPANSLRSE